MAPSDSHTLSSRSPSQRQDSDMGGLDLRPQLQVGRIKMIWEKEKGEYVPKPDDLGSKPDEDAEEKIDPTCPISVVRKFHDYNSVHVMLHVSSVPFITAAQEVMKSRSDINWKSRIVKFEPEELLAFLPQFQAHLTKLKEVLGACTIQDSERCVAKFHLEFILGFLESEYREWLTELRTHLETREITFDLLWGMMIPGTLLFWPCSTTKDEVVVRLVSLELEIPTGHDKDEVKHWTLRCESTDVDECKGGMVYHKVEIPLFHGPKGINRLEIYPITFYGSDGEITQLRHRLQKRGEYYTKLVSDGWCHKSYHGIAFAGHDGKVSVNSRIIIDRAMFEEYSYPEPSSLDVDLEGKRRGSDSRPPEEEIEYIMMPAVAFGYSLTEREWLRFQVKDIKPIEWSPEIFKELEFHDQGKDFLKSLIESHTKEGQKTFDDFVPGKGQGLIFNLHGPPGVGKTLTAEATSEVTGSPLYIMGVGDLGAELEALEKNLRKVFALAYRWKAVVLIDEADVFLEKRGLHGIERNAMVAVLLRQIEYYPGILFLTTNRIKVFDEAMMSRIHLSFYYPQLDVDARARLWKAFLSRTNLRILEEQSLVWLSKLPLNGREIKNIVKLSSAVAEYNNHTLSFEDIRGVVELRGEDLDYQLLPSYESSHLSAAFYSGFILCASILAFSLVRRQ